MKRGTENDRRTGNNSCRAHRAKHHSHSRTEGNLGQGLGHNVRREHQELNEQVRRNADRFPEDFMFQLTRTEAEYSRSQIATLNENYSPNNGSRQGINIKYLPYAFTEHGALMAASVLNSPQAVKVSIYVIRAFVKLREILSIHKQLSSKLDELERKLQKHDGQIAALFEAIRQLMEPPPDPPRKTIGFLTESEGPKLKAKKICTEPEP